MAGARRKVLAIHAVARLSSILTAASVTVALVVAAAQAASAADVADGPAGAGAHGTRTESTGVPPARYTVYGIDVSSHDHTATFPEIDWADQAARGVQFAYVKATEAQNYINPYFAGDARDAKQAGLLTGAYTFGRPDKRDPVGDANFFIDHAAWTNDSRTLVPFLDLEWPYFSTVGTCYNLTVAEMRAWIQQFLDQVRVRIGRNAMIYTAANWWNQCVGGTTQFAGYPLDVAAYSGTAPKLPGGWSSWTLWQYAGGDHSQRGNYDKDVFNGDLEALRRLAGIDPPPPLTSRPTAVDNSRSGRMEVYADAGGSLVERFWSQRFGWSSWSDFGGDIAGRPAVLRHPVIGSVEVYARGGNGHLLQKFYAGGRWSGWTDLGGSLAGDPVVFFNPRYGSTELYARGTNGHLMQKFYAGGWSGWTDLGGDLAGDPALLYNPKFSSTEIYVRQGDGRLAQKFYAGGWSAWQDLGGALAGDPAVFLSPVWGSTEVYARGANSHLLQKFHAGGWSGWNDLGGTLSGAGAPAVFYNPAYRSTEIYATGGGHLRYTLIMPGGGWSGWNDLGGALTSDASVVLNPMTGNTEIYAVSGGNLVTDLWLKGLGVWSGWSNIMQ